MNIVNAHPPNFPEIAAAFPHASKPGVIFSFGDTLYVPGGYPVSQELIAHETVHGRRQNAMGIMLWWDAYIRDPEFRLAEELPAHRAEFLDFCRRKADPNSRIRELMKVAERLASPLYGSLISVGEARRRISA